MKEYKIITGYASNESVEVKMNDYAKLGYVLDSFKTFDGGSYSIVIIMSRVKEPQTYLRTQALGTELKDISTELELEPMLDSLNLEKNSFLEEYSNKKSNNKSDEKDEFTIPSDEICI